MRKLQGILFQTHNMFFLPNPFCDSAENGSLLHTSKMKMFNGKDKEDSLGHTGIYTLQ